MPAIIILVYDVFLYNYAIFMEFFHKRTFEIHETRSDF